MRRTTAARPGPRSPGCTRAGDRPGYRRRSGLRRRGHAARGSGSDFAAQCSRFALYSTPYNDDNWQPVAGASGRLPVRPGGLQLTGAVRLPAGRVDVVRRVAFWRCLAEGHSGVRAGARVPAQGSGPALLACSRRGRTAIFTCSARRRAAAHGSLYTSTDAGQTWQKSGPFTGSGPVTSLAVAPTSGTLVAATSTGIFYSAQVRWAAELAPSRLFGLRPPAGGFSFVGMTTTMLGVAVPANAGAREIFITHDGGLQLGWPRRFLSRSLSGGSSWPGFLVKSPAATRSFSSRSKISSSCSGS